MLNIDGSHGEGGDQIIRTALGLSLVTGRAFHIENIRAGRPKPGLLRQHLTAVRAAAQIGRTEVSGAELKSQTLTFWPDEVTPGDYAFEIGSAGSATLVLQAVLPALLTADGPTTICLQGGTHNPTAPPFDFLQRSFLPLVEKMGPKITATLERYGFVARGGGDVRFSVEPVEKLRSLQLTERGKLRNVTARSIVAGLPVHIAERELDVVRRALDLRPRDVQVKEVDPTNGPRNVLLIDIQCEHVAEVITGFGRQGTRAEKVARAAAREARAYLKSNVPVGEHLADQLLVPLALAGAGQFITGPLSSHALTNIETIRMFLDMDVTVEEIEHDAVSVCVGANVPPD